MEREMDQRPEHGTALYCLADRCIEITPIHDYVHEYCADYRCREGCCEDGSLCCEEADSGREKGSCCSEEQDHAKKPYAKPDITVRITQADIDYERVKSAREDEEEGIPVRQFTDEYLETLAVYRKIAEVMPCFDTFLIHGSVIAADGQGYLFTAKSGTGKSTHTRLWRQLLGDRAVMINDDKPLVRVVSSGEAEQSGSCCSSEGPAKFTETGTGKDIAMIYGTPWCGKHGLNTNTSVPLKAICILERGKENRIREITKAEAALFLLKQIYRPADPQALMKTLSLLDKLNVRFYRLACNMEPEAAELAYSVMSKPEELS